MRVTVLLPGQLREAADGSAQVRAEFAGPATLGDVLDDLAARHPMLNKRLRDEQGTLRRYVNFYVDGEECRALDGVHTPLADGTEVQIIPSVAGG